MNVLKSFSKIAIVTAMIASSMAIADSAKATLVTVTASTSQTVSFSDAVTSFITPQSYNLFDTNGGQYTLTGVQLILNVSGSIGGSVQYLGATGGSINGTPSLDTWLSSANSAIDTLIGGGSVATAVAKVSITGAPISHTPNTPTTYTLTTVNGSGSSSPSLTAPPDDLSAFIATVGDTTDTLLLNGQSSFVGSFHGTWNFDQVGGDASGTAQIIYTYTYQTEQVPEPASMALLGSGLIGLGAMVRRRRRR